MIIYEPLCSPWPSSSNLFTFGSILYIISIVLFFFIHTSVNSVHNASVCLWRGPTWGVGEGEVCYRQTWPDTRGFRSIGPGVGGGGGRGLLQTDLVRHSRISTWPGPALSNFDPPDSACGVGECKKTTQTVVAGCQQVQWAGVCPGRLALFVTIDRKTPLLLLYIRCKTLLYH